MNKSGVDFVGRVTTRNFLKTKVQCYQTDTRKFGVPKGTISHVLSDFASTQICTTAKAKYLRSRSKLPVFMLDINGHGWTLNEGAELRKGYDSLSLSLAKIDRPFRVRTADPENTPCSIITSVISNFILSFISIQTTRVHRGMGAKDNHIKL